MRKWLLLLCLTVVLAACASGGTPDDGNTSGTTGDSPDTVARTWFNALMSGSSADAAAVTCNAERAAFESGAGEVEIPGEIDLSGVTFTVSEQTDTTAVVTMSGNMGITVSGQTVQQDIAASGVPPTVNLVREDNAWRVCS